LVLGGLQSGEARELFNALPTVEALMPALTLDDLGVTHWQPPDDIAAQLTTPTTTADLARRQERRAIESAAAGELLAGEAPDDEGDEL
jgi:hypothetical protein